MTRSRNASARRPLSWKARRRWALVILLLGMPAYVVAVITVLDLFPRLPFLAELAVYVGLGVLWALPFRFVFRGVGQPDPEAGGGSGDPPRQGAPGKAGRAGKE